MGVLLKKLNNQYIIYGFMMQYYSCAVPAVLKSYNKLKGKYYIYSFFNSPKKKTVYFPFNLQGYSKDGNKGQGSSQHKLVWTKKKLGRPLTFVTIPTTIVCILFSIYSIATYFLFNFL